LFFISILLVLPWQGSLGTEIRSRKTLLAAKVEAAKSSIDSRCKNFRNCPVRGLSALLGMKKQCCVQIVLLFDLKKEERAEGAGTTAKRGGICRSDFSPAYDHIFAVVGAGWPGNKKATRAESGRFLFPEP
jgi:hypothetical protein